MNCLLVPILGLTATEFHIGDLDYEETLHSCSLIEPGSWLVYACLAQSGGTASGLVALHSSEPTQNLTECNWMYQAGLEQDAEIITLGSVDLEFEDKKFLVSQGKQLPLPNGDFGLSLGESSVAIKLSLQHHVIQAFYGGASYRIMGIRLI